MVIASGFSLVGREGFEQTWCNVIYVLRGSLFVLSGIDFEVKSRGSKAATIIPVRDNGSLDESGSRKLEPTGPADGLSVGCRSDFKMKCFSLCFCQHPNHKLCEQGFQAGALLCVFACGCVLVSFTEVKLSYNKIHQFQMYGLLNCKCIQSLCRPQSCYRITSSP